MGGGQDPAGYSLYTIEELCFLLEPLRLRGTVRDRSKNSRESRKTSPGTTRKNFQGAHGRSQEEYTTARR